MEIVPIWHFFFGRIRVRDTQPHCNVEKRKEKRNLKGKKKKAATRVPSVFMSSCSGRDAKLLHSLWEWDLDLPTSFMSLLALRKAR